VGAHAIGLYRSVLEGLVDPFAGFAGTRYAAAMGRRGPLAWRDLRRWIMRAARNAPGSRMFTGV
jgi:hypothetical protein